MIKTIKKVGNSQGIILDTTLMEMAHLKVGDELNVTVHDSGSITFTPLRPDLSPEEFSAVVNEAMNDYAKTMKNLA